MEMEENKTNMIKEDCFAYNGNISLEKDRCLALDNLYCKNCKCAFYKTKEQEIKDRIKYNFGLEEY